MSDVCGHELIQGKRRNDFTCHKTVFQDGGWQLLTLYAGNGRRLVLNSWIADPWQFGYLPE